MTVCRPVLAALLSVIDRSNLRRKNTLNHLN
jgi:hypothetical protein